MKAIILLLTTTAKAYYDKSPLVDMKDYSENFRTLDVWECFEAKGKFCHDRDYDSMMKLTGSSNEGHGLCCKPDYSGNPCYTDKNTICSDPAQMIDASKTSNTEIYSEEGLNHQIFAFSTTTSQKECGISKDEKNHDMRLFANESLQLISTDEMKYQHGRPSVRQYDSCYYEVGAVEDLINDTQLNYNIQLSVIRATEINVYLYGGNSRYNATIPLVKGNQQVKVGETYTIDSSLGMLLVAYPNQDVETEFEFVYTLVPKVIPVPEVEKIYGQIEKVLEYEYAILVLFISLVLISLCIFCLCKKKAKTLNQVDHRRSTVHFNIKNVDADIEMQKGDVTSQHIQDKVNGLDVNFDGQTGNRATPQNMLNKETKASISMSREDAAL